MPVCKIANMYYALFENLAPKERTCASISHEDFDIFELLCLLQPADYITFRVLSHKRLFNHLLVLCCSIHLKISWCISAALLIFQDGIYNLTGFLAACIFTFRPSLERVSIIRWTTLASAYLAASRACLRTSLVNVPDDGCVLLTFITSYSKDLRAKDFDLALVADAVAQKCGVHKNQVRHRRLQLAHGIWKGQIFFQLCLPRLHIPFSLQGGQWSSTPVSTKWQ